MKKSYLYLIIIYNQINSQIIDNPIILAELKNPYIFSINEDNSYYIIVKGINLIIIKETSNIITRSNNEIEEECIFTHDFSNKNNLFCSNKYFTINNDGHFIYIEYEYNELIK